MLQDVTEITIANLHKLLEDDTRVKVAGIDVDGMLRGKILDKEKFFDVAQSGFGFCSVLFGWDMHDQVYFRELKISNSGNGGGDILALIDLQSFRRIPWEDGMPFFLVSWYDPRTMKRISACPRGLLDTVVDKLNTKGMTAMAGAEIECSHFKTPAISPNSQLGDKDSSSKAAFLRENHVNGLLPITEGRFGYSVTRPTHNKDYFYGIFDTCKGFDCRIEGWHTESGLGVYEAALNTLQGLLELNMESPPCFMAKPRQGMPGNAGHVHISLIDKNGNNVFMREKADTNAEWEDITYLSDIGRQFLAGILEGLPDIMPLLAPTVNSYKRLVENFFAPVSVSWGLEHRIASVRVIAPPTSSPKATRFEVRVPGSDTNAHYVFAALLAIGLRGIEKKLQIPCPPLGKTNSAGIVTEETKLAGNLKEATERFMLPGSIAREVLGDDFVEHFGGTREHEIHLWNEAVTDWEVRRYMETV
ncbi:hypothetical protein N7493_000865 [Penicillium malachiteum]|uniref:Glutamine synthetase n=1 Tax=Penicillium malachiteum TaxID=1324776 RepID=A0AAD6HX52_9EURO|nr:hypothetical protein N7493_000865 [Penicillium malachiteum]